MIHKNSGPDQRPDVLLINRDHCIAVLTDSSNVPVVHWFDIFGEECDPDDAVTCVAGSDEKGWYAVDLQNFDYATVH